MIKGYLSVEWLALAMAGFLLSTVLAWFATFSAERHSSTKLWLIGFGISAAHYVVLRLAGKTPLGIALPSEPAANGHPRLSMAVAAFSVLTWTACVLTR